MERDLPEEARDRMDRLDAEYLNSRECNELSYLIAEIEAGEAAKKRLEFFLDKVPVGAYDSNRRKYRLP